MRVVGTDEDTRRPAQPAAPSSTLRSAHADAGQAQSGLRLRASKSKVIEMPVPAKPRSRIPLSANRVYDRDIDAAYIYLTDQIDGGESKLQVPVESDGVAGMVALDLTRKADSSLDDYVELQLRIEGTAARQYLGAHKGCLEQHTMPNVHVEIEPDD